MLDGLKEWDDALYCAAMYGRPFRIATQLALLPGLLGLAGCGKNGQPAARPGPSLYQVDVITIKPRAYRETLYATGTLRAREAVTLHAERAGVIQEVRFEEGKPVKAGEVLILMDDSELRAQLDRARAQLELAASAERRDRALRGSDNLISEAAYDESLAHLHVMQAETALIEAQLRKTRVMAPFDGIAGLRLVSVGAYVTPGTPLSSFQDISALKLDFTLPERYLQNLRNARQVNFRVAGVGDSLEATIYALEPSVDVSTRSLQVRALAANEDQRLLPGSFAEVEVELQEIPEAILIPPIALVPGWKAHKVFVHHAGQVEERAVEPGLRSSDAVQILSGLKPGEELIVTGTLQLRAGMKVKVRPVADQTTTDPDSRGASAASGGSNTSL